MKTLSRSLLFLIVLSTSSASLAAAQCLEWDTKFYGHGAQKYPVLNANVNELVEFDDGTGPALYFGGEFTHVWGVAANNLAKWNGVSFSEVGGGVGDSPAAWVASFCVFDDGSGPALFVGGSFSDAGGMSASNIAKWNGTSWSTLGSGLNATVTAMAVYDDGSGEALYVGGLFTQAGGIAASRIARWNGTSWSDIGNGPNGSVSALHVFDAGAGPDLYVGGVFSSVGGFAANNVATWNGVSGWADIGGTVGTIFTFETFDDGSGARLYAGGTMTSAGGIPVNNIARYDGLGTWSALGIGTNSKVSSLRVWNEGSGDALYLAGGFGLAGGLTAKRTARWNGTAFTPLGTGVDWEVRVICPFGGELIAGGGFSEAGDLVVNRLAAWDGSSWSQFVEGGMGIERATGPFVATTVQALTSFDDGAGLALYVGGTFRTAGDATDLNNIARWNGSSWSPLSSGIGASDGEVRALTVFDDGSGSALYVGGDFDHVGGVSAKNIAKWNGSAWTALASGITGSVFSVVRAMTVFDDGNGPALYACGQFTNAGGFSVNNIAKWNGTTWKALSSGCTGGGAPGVYALAVFDDGAGPVLFAGGEFTSAGGVAANRIAKWNGTSWSAAGNFNGWVAAFAVHDDGGGAALFAGGAFTTESGMSTNYIAKRVGGAWSAMGTGMDHYVRALYSFHDGTEASLHIGGDFLTADGISVNHVARWNGSTFDDLGGGTDAPVLALCEFEDGEDGAPDLYAGGSFFFAGGAPSHSIAQWRGCPPGDAYCFGDGIDPIVTAQCPCGNFGDPGHGCGNSVFASGARLAATGTKTPNTLLFTLTNVPNNALATGFRNTTNNPTGAVFGDGVRCQTGTLVRFGSHNTGTAGDAPNTWTAGVDTIAPGLTRYYLVQYRNSSGFCPPETFNVSHGYRIAW